MVLEEEEEEERKKDGAQTPRACPAHINTVGPGHVIWRVKLNLSRSSALTEDDIRETPCCAQMRWIQVKAIIFYWCLLLNRKQSQRRKCRRRETGELKEGFKHWDTGDRTGREKLQDFTYYLLQWPQLRSWSGWNENDSGICQDGSYCRGFIFYNCHCKIRPV